MCSKAVIEQNLVAPCDFIIFAFEHQGNLTYAQS